MVGAVKAVDELVAKPAQVVGSPHAASRTPHPIKHTTPYAPRPTYSLFNASTGFTREALSAGTQLAPSATASRSPAIVT